MSWARDIVALVRRLIRAETAAIHTTLPGEVVSYNAATNTCSVRPCVHRLRAEDADNMTTVELPVLEDVPVKQFGSGKLLLSVAPAAGSYGLLHVSERSIENWWALGGTGAPSSARRFDLSDAFFDPGIYPLLPDGNNGLVTPPINTDRIELRTRLGTSFISVVDDGTIEISAMTLGTISISLTGTVDINGNLTVLP